MDRRNFLRSMLGVAAVTALPSEVWPFKKIFLPPTPSRIDIIDLRFWGKKPLDIAAIETLELEYFSKELPDLIFRPSPFYDLLKRNEPLLIGSAPVNLSYAGIPRAKYPGRLPVALRPRNILHAPATPENVLEFIDDLEDLSKRES